MTSLTSQHTYLSLKTFFVVALLMLAGTGCEKNVETTPWEAAKFALKIKKRADLHKSLIEIPASAYAIKLITNCKSNPEKCIEAIEVLRFAFILTEGKDSAEAKIMCDAKNSLTQLYIAEIRMELDLKRLDENYSSDDIENAIKSINSIENRRIENCKK